MNENGMKRLIEEYVDLAGYHPETGVLTYSHITRIMKLLNESSGKERWRLACIMLDSIQEGSITTKI
tara:strand:- start:3344 stop:3544 length:201 start_codon:yes stop_codon:yes gene_type:complete